MTAHALLPLRPPTLCAAVAAAGYTRRRPEELAVLTRWFPAAAVTASEARYLDVILYSREQLVKEYADMPSKDGSGGQVGAAGAGLLTVSLFFLCRRCSDR